MKITSVGKKVSTTSNGSARPHQLVYAFATVGLEVVVEICETSLSLAELRISIRKKHATLYARRQGYAVEMDLVRLHSAADDGGVFSFSDEASSFKLQSFSDKSHVMHTVTVTTHPCMVTGHSRGY